MRRLILVLAMLIALVGAGPAAALPGGTVGTSLPPVAPLPVETPPPVTAKAWILYDATHDLVLAAHDPDTPRPMASTTKIMTALVALEEGDPDQMVTVSERAAAVGEAEIGLVPGERLRLGDLVRMLLVRSANDAAMAVAEAVGGSMEGFVELMNRKAEQLGLTGTRFANPHGLDTDGHHSTPRDLLHLARAAMENPAFAEAAAATVARIPDDPEGTPRVAETTNRLLDEYPGAIGVKTGFTNRAGLVLVAAADREGRTLYAVVMGSEGPSAHFVDATALLDHGFADYGIVPTVLTGARFLADEDDRQALTTAARVETALHLAALGLDGTTPAPGIGALGSPRLPPRPETTAPSLPGLAEAARWFFSDE